MKNTFRDQVADFLAKHSMPPTELGLAAVNDGRFVADILANRRSPTLSTVNTIVAYMDNFECGNAASDARERRAGANEAPELPVVAFAGRVIEFVLDTPFPLLNGTRRMCKHAYKRHREGLSWSIKIATQGQRPLGPLLYARVTIERRSIRLVDKDGAYGGAKALIDCLLPPSKRHPSGLGICFDDNEKHMDQQVIPIRVGHKAERGTTVRIVELEHSPLGA